MISNRNLFKTGRLSSRPQNPGKAEHPDSGVHLLDLGGERDGLLYLPKSYQAGKAAALAVMLHGAGGQAEHGLELIRRYSDERNIIVMAPASRKTTWDIIAGGSFDADVLRINQALRQVFSEFHMDTRHIALGGFSDGASYALSLGLSNGDLFTHLIAFSPGFCYTVENKGKPPVFISHGIHDGILPINPCSRRLVPFLKKAGHTINYHEFEGGHEIPGHISDKAIEWFLG